MLAKVCAGQLERSEEARQESQLVHLSSHKSRVAGGGESWEWLRNTCPLMSTQQGGSAGTMLTMPLGRDG